MRSGKVYFDRVAHSATRMISRGALGIEVFVFRYFETEREGNSVLTQRCLT